MTDWAPAGVRLPFNRPYVTGQEFQHIGEAIANGYLAGNGPFTERCATWLAQRTGSSAALLTTSCTSALELAMLLAGVGPGDEVVMPSFTFVSTANAVALRGGVPVFADIRSDTLNLDEALIEGLLTPRTKAIVPVHYAGVACDMDAISELAAERGLLVVEDAAQGLMSAYRGRPLGSIGRLACLSFHETKNVISGEGGALLVNDPEWVDRAEVMQEKGTNRRQFFRGQADRYTWVDLGSSFVPSEITAAFLWAQLEHADAITAQRRAIWGRYHERFESLEAAGRLRRPIVPADCAHNAHMYYLLLRDSADRDRLISSLDTKGIMAVFHYVPLHSSPAGRRFGRTSAALPETDRAAERLLRLPLWVGMTELLVELAVALEVAGDGRDDEMIGAHLAEMAQGGLVVGQVLE